MSKSIQNEVRPRYIVVGDQAKTNTKTKTQTKTKTAYVTCQGGVCHQWPSKDKDKDKNKDKNQDKDKDKKKDC